jgi:RHS repeat-associated protein
MSEVEGGDYELAKAVEAGTQQVLIPAIKDMGTTLEKVSSSVGTGAERVADTALEADATAARGLHAAGQGLDGTRPEGGVNPNEGTPAPQSGGQPPKSGPTQDNFGGKGGSSAPGEEGSLNGQPGEDGQLARPDEEVPTDADPVDVATGAVRMSHVDLDLPGVLPLTITRVYSSEYRAGRVHGAAWSGTLDQRAEIGFRSIRVVRADGSILTYPRPEPGVNVLPTAGDPWPLRWGGGINDLLTVTDPRRGWTWHYAVLPADGGSGAMHWVALTDRVGHRIDVDYDPVGGVPRLLRHSGGYRVAVDADEGRITGLRVLDPAGSSDTVAAVFDYDDARRLAEVAYGGDPTVFKYDAQGRIIAWSGPNGSGYRYVYDEQGRCVHGEGALGMMSATFDYDSVPGSTLVTDAEGNTTAYEIGAGARVTAVTDPLGNVTRIEFDARGRVMSRTDALGRATTYGYDPRGNLATVQRPDGMTATLRYDEHSRLAESTGYDGGTWHYTYDEVGRPVRIVDPIGAAQSYGYDELGHLAAVTNPLGETRRVQADAAGMLIASRTPAGATSTLTRDTFGRAVVLTDALGMSTITTWSLRGQPLSCMYPDGTCDIWERDSDDNLLAHTDRSGATTRYEYGPFNLVTARISPDGTRYTFEYDRLQRLIAVGHPAGMAWRYEYDAVGNLVSETDFDGAVVRYEYDAAGNVVSRSNSLGQTITYVRDTLDRVIEQRIDGTGTLAFSYGPGDNLLSADAPGVSSQFVHDALGRVVAETTNGRTLESEFDALGRRVSRRTPAGTASRWQYAADGTPTILESGPRRLAFGHDAAGNETYRWIGDNLAITGSWDGLGRLERQQLLAIDGPADARNSTVLHEREWGYRADGMPISVRDSVNGARTLTVDGVGRVTAVDGANWTERYAYDAAGNLATSESPTAHPDTVGTRTATGTLVRSSGRTQYEYDAQGRVVRATRATLSGQRRTWTYVYDACDQLTDVTTPDGSHWRYIYDALGRRVAKQRLDEDDSILEETWFTWQGTVLVEQTHRIAEQPAQRATTWDHIPGSFTPVAQTTRSLLADAPQEVIDERFHAIITDLVGAPTELVALDGRIEWRRVTDIWGNPMSRSETTAEESVECLLGFPGQYRDDETGLHFNYHRYYDPANGRYTTPDPLGIEPSPNNRAYVANPSIHFDPLGLAAGGLDPSANHVHGHIAEVIIRRADGSVRLSYGIFSGQTTPEETAATSRGFNRQAVTHTEHRISRLSGASTGPKVNIPNDPYFNKIPVNPGESVEINAVLPPCSRCQGAMNRMRNELGANVTYNWDGPLGAGTWP